MMKKLLLLLYTTALAHNAHAQIDDVEAAKKSAFMAAKTMDEALINKHYDDYVVYNHPKVLEQVKGGRVGMAIQIAQQIKDIEESGNVITAVWPKMPETMIDTAGEWQTSLQQFMEYRLPEGKIKSETTIIGISPDKGKTWYFLDVAGRQLKDLKELFPQLSSQLVIPPAKEAEFTPDK